MQQESALALYIKNDLSIFLRGLKKDSFMQIIIKSNLQLLISSCFEQ